MRCLKQVFYSNKRGFKKLHEADIWELKVGESYFVTRNDSSLIAFHYANENWAEKACRLVGAHSDSPCLKVKPNALTTERGYVKVGVELYGGCVAKSLV